MKGLSGGTAPKIYNLFSTQSLSILSNAARLNPSRRNMAAPYRQDQLFAASQRSERDLNDPCNIEGLGLPSYLSQPLRGMLHVIFWLCGQELIPSLPSPRGTWRQQQDTLGRIQQDEAFSQIATARHGTARHAALQFVFLLLWTHLMKTNELSPLLLQPGSVQHC